MSELHPRRRAAAEVFAAVFGTAPQRVWTAPGRVNLLGEHTDYNDGLCLPLGLQFGADCAVRSNRTGMLRVASAQRPGEVVTLPCARLSPGAVTGWAAYVAGAVWAAAPRATGLDVLIDSDVPEGAGLSSSAAVEVATAAAVSGLRGDELARAAHRAESEFVGVPCGDMDQTVSVLARKGAALLFDADDLSAQQVDLALGKHALLVLDTRAPHRLSDGAYAERRRQCDDAAAALGVASLRQATSWDGLDGLLTRRARHVLTENDRVRAAVGALRDGDVDRLGRLMTASHISLRDDFEVTVPELDVAVEVALHAGALGARMTGGGFGGSIVALVDDAALVAGAVEAAFAGRGWAEPRWFVAQASAGAHPVR